MQKTHHSIFITQFPSLITLKYQPVWHHHFFSSLNIFHTICGPHTLTQCQLTFSLSLSLSLSLFSFFFLFPLPLPFVFLFVLPCFSLLFSSSMLTYILIKPTMILIFMLFPNLQYNQMAIQFFSFTKTQKKKKKITAT